MFFTRSMFWGGAALLLLVAAGATKTADAALLAFAEPSCCPEPTCCAPAPAPKCCYNPCIEYRHKHCWKKKTCCGCEAPQNIVLSVEDPCCCGCAVEVPVCIPACCTGEPKVSSRCFLGRGTVTYTWCCGYKLTVTLKKCGDVVVTYYGS